MSIYKDFLKATASTYGYKLSKLRYTQNHVYKVEFEKSEPKPFGKLFIEFASRKKEPELSIKAGYCDEHETQCYELNLNEIRLLHYIIETTINNDKYWYSEDYLKDRYLRKKENNNVI